MTLRRQSKLDVTDCCFKEAQFYQAKKMPDMYNHTAKIAPLALVVPLFSITRAETDKALPAVDVIWHHGRGNLRYKGPTLTQSHLTVLLVLVNLLAGGLADNYLYFYASDLLRKMGWSHNSENIARLTQLLDDLKEGQVRTWAAGQDEQKNAARVSFIDMFTPSETEKWVVRLSVDVLPYLFAGDLTNINLPKRAQLREGLSTFLYGYISAESCRLAFTYEAIHAASGSRATDMREFGKSCRAVLEGLRKTGHIVDFTLHRGGFKVLKDSKQSAE